MDAGYGNLKSQNDEYRHNKSLTSSDLEICLICSGPCKSKLVKNSEFESALQLFWCTLKIDVKPTDCRKCNLCEICFAKLVEYNEINDILCLLENVLKLKKQELIKSALKGIKAKENSDNDFSQVQMAVKNQYTDGALTLESEDEEHKRILSQYNWNVEVTQTTHEENKGQKSAGLLKQIIPTQKNKI